MSSSSDAALARSRKMVKLLKSGSSSSSSLPPIWVMPVFGGTTACFDRMLNSYSNYKRTLYGLTDAYITGDDDALTLSLEEWVNTYVSAIKSKQEHGPYTLVGYSQGMNWCYAVAEALRKQGETTDAMICLDPCFPNWNNMDKILDWNAPIMAEGLGAPVCVARLAANFMMVGPMKQAGNALTTQAGREATISAVIAKEFAGTDLYDIMVVHTEMDTGKTIVEGESPMSFIKKIPANQRLEKMTELIASKFEGLDTDLVKRILEFRCFSALRWVPYVPEKVPASTKCILVYADRSHIASYKGKPYSVTQGFERFHEKGMAQINEVVIKMDDAPADWPGKRMEAMFKVFDDHFRFMHMPNVWAELKTEIWDKIGMF